MLPITKRGRRGGEGNPAPTSKTQPKHPDAVLDARPPRGQLPAQGDEPLDGGADVGPLAQEPVPRGLLLGRVGGEPVRAGGVAVEEVGHQHERRRQRRQPVGPLQRLRREAEDVVHVDDGAGRVGGADDVCLFFSLCPSEGKGDPGREPSGAFVEGELTRFEAGDGLIPALRGVVRRDGRELGARVSRHFEGGNRRVGLILI